MTVVLDRDTARGWLGLPAAVISDDQLDLLIAAEQANQARLCRIDPDQPQPALVQALIRRLARAAAAKSVPLGLVGDGEYGAARIPVSDAELERIEGPWRKVIFA